VEGKSFGMELGALEREGRRCITFSLSPCLCCYSLGPSITPRMRYLRGWTVGLRPIMSIRRAESDISYYNRLLTPPTHVHLHENAGAHHPGVKISDGQTLCDPMKYKHFE
jgi:hypothetical protein